MNRRAHIAGLLVVLLCPHVADAQECDGDDPEAARTEYEAGSALLAEAIVEARRRSPRARELAREALERFDRQCEHGDTNALAERGAALMLMGEPLRSAQSYDAFLREQESHGGLDERTRERVEANLQPCAAVIELDRGTGWLFVDGLDFGPLPREAEVHLPAGEHHVEARAVDGSTIAQAIVTLEVGEEARTVRLTTRRAPRADYTNFYIAAAVLAGAGIIAGPSFLALHDERQRTYDDVCVTTEPTRGCPETLAERDAALGVSVAAFVVAGLATVGLVALVILDVTQPPLRVAVAPDHGGATLQLTGTF